MQSVNLPRSNSSTSKLPVPFFGLAFVLLSCASLASSCTEQEKSSLIDFRDGLSQEGKGSLSVSWANSTDCCRWEGITCSFDGMVTGVSLSSKGLQGRIPPSLSNLTGLLHLNLSHNSLYGNLPAEMVFSSRIIILDVSFNHLSGPLQESQSSNTSLPLKVLNISSNFFTGQLPSTTLQVMNNPVALNASNNSFTGQIPSICNHSPSLAMLDLSLNKFTGTISPEFGNCSTLKVLKAGHNKLASALPHELFNATLLEHLLFQTIICKGHLMVPALSNSVIWFSLILDQMNSVARCQTLLGSW